VKRKIYDRLLEWKEKDNGNCTLLIDGARRVGKSYIVEEFLWAIGDETTIPFLKDYFENLKPVGQAMHRRVMNDFRKYIVIGGMPQAVEAYSRTKDFETVDRIKKGF